MDERNPTRYAIVPIPVFEALSGDAYALAVYSALASYRNADGEAWPFQETLAADLGISDRTVRRKIEVLKSAGLVDVEPRVVAGLRRGNRYKLRESGTDSGVLSVQDSGVLSTRARDPLFTKGTTPMEQENPPTPLPADVEILDPGFRKPELNVVPLHPGRLLDVPSTVDVVFAAWTKSRRGSSRVILTPKRRKVIEARIREGYEADDLLDAVVGWRRSPFHCGANEQRTVYNELTLLLRDGEHLERFRDLERAHRSGDVSTLVSGDPLVEQMRRVREIEGRG